jgi:hypothetical protein
MEETAFSDVVLDTIFQYLSFLDKVTFSRINVASNAVFKNLSQQKCMELFQNQVDSMSVQEKDELHSYLLCRMYALDAPVPKSSNLALRLYYPLDGFIRKDKFYAKYIIDSKHELVLYRNRYNHVLAYLHSNGTTHDYLLETAKNIIATERLFRNVSSLVVKPVFIKETRPEPMQEIFESLQEKTLLHAMSLYIRFNTRINLKDEIWNLLSGVEGLTKSELFAFLSQIRNIDGGMLDESESLGTQIDTTFELVTSKTHLFHLSGLYNQPADNGSYLMLCTDRGIEVALVSNAKSIQTAFSSSDRVALLVLLVIGFSVTKSTVGASYPVYSIEEPFKEMLVKGLQVYGTKRRDTKPGWLARAVDNITKIKRFD